MFRIIKAEIKKTFAKPGIFILTAVLICVLFASAMFYTPKVRDNNMVSLETKSSASTSSVRVKDMYDSFKSTKESSSSQGLDNNTEVGFNNEVDNIKKFVNFYYYTYYQDSEYGKTLDDSYLDESIVTIADLNQDLKDIEKYLQEYEKKCTEPNDARVTARNNLKTAILNLQTDLTKVAPGTNKPNSSTKIVALIKEDARKELNDNVLLQAYKYLNIEDGKEFSLDKTAFDNLVKLQLVKKINDTLTQFVEFKPSQAVLDNCLSYVKETSERATDYAISVEEFYKQNSTSTEKDVKKEFNLIVTKYKLTIKECKDIVEQSIYFDALKDFSANEITKFTATQNIDKYSLQESLTKNEFMFNNKTFYFDYATPLSITQTSNDNANAYDFAYFALRLCLFIIIIYTVVLAAGSIAGEQQAGTFKLLAIRPFSRTKLFMGKLLSTILMGFILLLVSVVATFIAGLIKFGTAASLPVLIVFNATSAFTMPVFVEFLISLLTMCFEITFFVIMAYAISTIFKSNVGAVAISIFIYFASLILNTIAPTATVLRFLPFTNINLFKYFGSSFLSTQASSFLFAVLTPSVILGQTFVFSLLMSGLFALLILLISVIVFNKRDLR